MPRERIPSVLTLLWQKSNACNSSLRIGGICEQITRTGILPGPTWENRKMKAVGYQKSLPIEASEALIDFETAKPEPKGRDIRVAVKAISANPVDYKVRKPASPPAGEFKILGFDAAGIVDAIGSDVTL